jgi:hypothetical protein
VRPIINFISTHHFWNAANHVTLAELDEISLPVRFGLALVSSTQILKNSTHLQQTDLQAYHQLNGSISTSDNSVGPISSFTILVAVAWKELSKESSVVKAKPERLSTDFLDDPKERQLLPSVQLDHVIF